LKAEAWTEANFCKLYIFKVSELSSAQGKRHNVLCQLLGKVYSLSFPKNYLASPVIEATEVLMSIDIHHFHQQTLRETLAGDW